MKSLMSDIIIEAPKEVVWQILMDFSSYPEWNPFIKQIAGSAKVGSILSVDIQPPNKDAMHFEPKVLVFEEGKEFRWLGKLFVKGLFDGEHYFQLEAINAKQTRLIHGEHFKGLISAVILKMIGENTLAGFIAMNEALKARAESIYKLQNQI